MVNLLLILVSITTEDRSPWQPLLLPAATLPLFLALFCFLLIPQHQGLQWVAGMGLREDALPPLSSHFLSSPADSNTEHTKRNRERTKQNLVRREKSISLKVMQKERESLSRGGVWALFMWHIKSTYTFSTQTSVQFKSAQPCPSGWNPLGKGSCPADEIRKGRETPLPTHPHPVKPLWLLLISPHPSCHSCFFTQSLPLTLSLQITRAKSWILALNTAAAKLNFAHSIWKFWSSSVRNKPHGNHVYISFQLEGAL